jgi:hypothetical protein
MTNLIDFLTQTHLMTLKLEKFRSRLKCSVRKNTRIKRTGNFITDTISICKLIPQIQSTAIFIDFLYQQLKQQYCHNLLETSTDQGYVL